MAPKMMVEVVDPQDGRTRQFEADAIRKIAREELGMVDGPFELTIFTKQLLATAVQREQVLRSEKLREAMIAGGPGYRDALKAVATINELMEQLGIEDAGWIPGAPEPKVVTEPAPPKKPVTTGDQAGLLEDQGGLF